jgi:hypothetical protein
LIVLVGTVALLQTGCSAEPTETESADPGAVATSTQAVILTVSGKDSIINTGDYKFHANWEGLYPQVLWYTRSCSTLTVASCTGTWNRVLDVAHVEGSTGWDLTRHLVWDCGASGKKSFQNKVVASGFAQPAQTVYKVTKLCGIGAF